MRERIGGSELAAREKSQQYHQEFLFDLMPCFNGHIIVSILTEKQRLL